MAIDKIFKKSVAFLDPRNHQLQNILQRVVQNSTKNIVPENKPNENV